MAELKLDGNRRVTMVVGDSEDREVTFRANKQWYIGKPVMH